MIPELSYDDRGILQNKGGGKWDQAAVKILLLFCGVGDYAEELEGLPERVFELVQIARPDKEALTLGNLMLCTFLIHGDPTPLLNLYHMLVIMVMKRSVASRGNEEMTHDYIAGTVIRSDEDFHPDIVCTFHLHLRCEDLRVVVYLHCN